MHSLQALALSAGLLVLADTARCQLTFPPSATIGLPSEPNEPDLADPGVMNLAVDIGVPIRSSDPQVFGPDPPPVIQRQDLITVGPFVRICPCTNVNSADLVRNRSPIPEPAWVQIWALVAMADIPNSGISASSARGKLPRPQERELPREHALVHVSCKDVSSSCRASCQAILAAQICKSRSADLDLQICNLEGKISRFAPAMHSGRGSSHGGITVGGHILLSQRCLHCAAHM